MRQFCAGKASPFIRICFALFTGNVIADLEEGRRDSLRGLTGLTGCFDSVVILYKWISDYDIFGVRCGVVGGQRGGWC